MSSIVRLRDVAKSYHRGSTEIKVLEDINLDIETGDFVALMGPSGSGKTTLLNLIGGIDQPTHGAIEVAGSPLESLNPRELARFRSEHIGFVFQFYNLLPVLSAERNVELPLLLTPLDRAERRHHARIALRIVGLEDRARHRPGELSGGQQQRVAIARALVSDPDLLVCDEPTGDLDRATADDILALLGLLNRDFGKTIVMVTHDPKAAQHAARVLELDKGRLVTSATH
ncbi:MAG: ABC transporter ATP-binding protein [Pseudomonadales bacterium]